MDYRHRQSKLDDADFRSDTFCQLSTGIATGTRKHYTNDEEHVYEVKRPVLFNGIPENLIQRGDLASRTIKLDILPITTRRTDAHLEDNSNALGRGCSVRCWTGWSVHYATPTGWT